MESKEVHLLLHDKVIRLIEWLVAMVTKVYVICFDKVFHVVNDGIRLVSYSGSGKVKPCVPQAGSFGGGGNFEEAPYRPQ